MVNETNSAAAETPEIGVCVDMKNNLINAGAFIQVEDAAKSLLAYLNFPGTPARDDPKHIYGHIFGLNTLRTLLNNIDLFNKDAPEDKVITGIRVYYGISERYDADFPLNPPHGKFRDLIFMPVVPSGKDLYPIDPELVDPQLILSESRPCPTQCPKFVDQLA
jgi:hypothetical protein